MQYHTAFIWSFIYFSTCLQLFLWKEKCVYTSKRQGGCVCGVCVRITDSRARLWKQSFFPSSLHSRWFSGELPRCSSKTAGRDLQCTLGYHSAQGPPCHIVKAHLLLCFTSQAWTPPKRPDLTHPNPTGPHSEGLSFWLNHQSGLINNKVCVRVRVRVSI